MPSTISAGTTAGTAIAVAGDTTGNLAFQTNGTTTAMTIDTSQNVGIGTTTPSQKLVVSGSGAQRFDIVDTGGATVRTSTSGGVGFVGTTTNHPLVMFTNDDERMRIDNSGNVGIGGTPDIAKFAVANNTPNGTYDTRIYGVVGTSTTYLDSDASGLFGAGAGEFQIQNGTSSRPAMLSLGGSLGTDEALGTINFFRSGNTDDYRSRAQIAGTVTSTGTANQHGGILRFYTAANGATNPSERMRITEGGAVFFLSLASGAGTNALRWSTSTGQMTYDTSSARYKDNIRDSVYGLSHVMQMRSAQFEYKDNARSDVGFIAEEMQSIVPELVGLDKDGQADSVSYDRMVSVLVKAIQELNAKVDAQAAEIAALKGAAL
jgi:hypothetical protein